MLLSGADAGSVRVKCLGRRVARDSLGKVGKRQVILTIPVILRQKARFQPLSYDRVSLHTLSLSPYPWRYDVISSKTTASSAENAESIFTTPGAESYSFANN